MRHATLLIALSAASLFACGKSDEAPAPATEPPLAQAPAPAPIPPTAPEPAAPEAPSATPAPPPPEQPTPPAPAVSAPAAPATRAPAAAPAPAAAAPTMDESRVTPAATPPADLAKGQAIYRKACAFCHDTGAAGAPKLGNQAAWAPRIAQGMDVLYTSSLRGKGAMPAKGGNPSLSEADVKAATDFLVAQSR